MDNHQTSNQNRGQHLIKMTPLVLLLTIGVNILMLIFLGWPRFETWIPALHTETPTSTLTLTPPPSLTPSSTVTPPLVPTETSLPSPTPTSNRIDYFPDQGVLILSIREGLNIHLFAYQPFLEPAFDRLTALPLTRLTAGSGKNIHPAYNPVDPLLAFASNRDGKWDLYLLNLDNGELTRFTDTPGYEGNPSWSPDGKWLAYERYDQKNLEIYLQDLEGKNAPINLTSHPGADHSPTWSPGGRRIAFVSNRGGNPSIWIADLNQQQLEERFYQVNPLASRSCKHPTWSPDNRFLSWARPRILGRGGLIAGIGDLAAAHPAVSVVQHTVDGQRKATMDGGRVVGVVFRKQTGGVQQGHKAGTKIGVEG